MSTTIDRPAGGKTSSGSCQYALHHFIGGQWEQLLEAGLHVLGKDGVRFFTENKVEAVRWFSRPEAAAALDATEAGA